jgi:Tol biopolymer transport system component
MTDQDVRDFLERMAAEEPTPDLDAEPLTRRARHRAARTVVIGAVGVAAAAVVLFAGIAEIRTARIPADQPTPTLTPVASGALAYALDGDIYVAEPDGSNAVRITDASADAGCEGFSEYSIPDPPWSPDGRYLAFQRNCTSPRETAVVITDSHGSVVGEFPAYGGGWGLTWSPDSTRVAVWEPALTIGVYGVDGRRQASLPEPAVTGGGTSAAPGWMPDGSALLLYGYAVMPLDGSAGHELSSGRDYSPDGMRYAVDMGHSFAIYDADGSPVSEASVRPDQQDPGVEAWSPDGERLASLSHGELNVIDVASGTVTVLPEARAALDGGDEIVGVRGFSPEGDRILYATDAGAEFGNTALWSIGVDGSDARLVIAGTTDGEWRPR